MWKILLIGGMALFLTGASIFAALTWMSTGPVDMGAHGWVAMGLGVVLSLVVGVGLMALVFYSSRRGYDDAVENFEE